MGNRLAIYINGLCVALKVILELFLGWGGYEGMRFGYIYPPRNFLPKTIFGLTY